MLGRVFDDLLAAERSVSVNQGTEEPFGRPSHIAFLGPTRMAVVDKYNEVYVQEVTGGISTALCSKEARKNRENVELQARRRYEAITSSLVVQLQGDAKNDSDSEGENGSEEWPNPFHLQRQRLQKRNGEDDGSIQSASRNDGAVALPREEKLTRVHQSYMDIAAASVCRIPLSKNIAIADVACDHIKVINASEWYLDRTLGSKGTGDGELSDPRGIASFKVGFDALLCVSDSGNNRVQVLTDSFQMRAKFGSHGSSNKGLRNPTSIAAWAPSDSSSSEATSSAFNPSWYVGAIESAYALQDRLSERGGRTGSFVVGTTRDKSDRLVFEVLYYMGPKKTQKVSLRARAGGGVEIALATHGAATEYESVWSYLRQNKALRCHDDWRPFASLAVVDKGNERVQLLRYYWTNSVLYTPSLEYADTIGGIRGRRRRLADPSCVAYSRTGELAICDASLQQVLLFAPTLQLIAVLDSPFSASVRNGSLPITYLASLTREQVQALQPADRQQLKQAMERRTVIEDKRCLSVAFSDEGRLAVGFSQGGLVVRGSYKVFAVGSLSRLHESDLHLVLSFCSFAEAQRLRDSCQYLHRCTRLKRLRWQLNPLRDQVVDRVVLNFVLWGRMLDERRALHTFGRFTDHCGRAMCNNFLDGSCENYVCTDSHERLLIERERLQQAGIVIELQQLQVVVTKVFSAKFLWQCEAYIAELFRAYSRRFLLQQRASAQPLAAACLQEERSAVKMVRAVEVVEASALDFDSYLEVMTVLEEDFSGARQLHSHSLFRRRDRSAFEPQQAYAPDYSTLFGQEDRRPLAAVSFKKAKAKRLVAVDGLDGGQQLRGGNGESKDFNDIYKHRTDALVSLLDRL